MRAALGQLPTVRTAGSQRHIIGSLPDPLGDRYAALGVGASAQIAE